MLNIIMIGIFLTTSDPGMISSDEAAQIPNIGDPEIINTVMTKPYPRCWGP